MTVTQCWPNAPLSAPAQYTETWFEMLFQAVDRLHDAASLGQLEQLSAIAPADMIGWLEDIIYTAQQTIGEIRGHQPGSMIEAGLAGWKARPR